MSKAIKIHRGIRAAHLDCGHIIDRKAPITWDYGDEVDCPVCAEIKAAREEVFTMAHAFILGLAGDNHLLASKRFQEIYKEQFEAERGKP